MVNTKFSMRQTGIIGEEQIRKYAVLVPIIKTPEGLFLLFEKRSNKLKQQPGEVCFPGGKLEPNESLEECAIRETIEELEVDRNQINILGPGDLFISPFNLIIYPFLGVISDYNNSYSKDEVESIIKIPMDFFRNHRPLHYKGKIINNPPEDFPYEWVPNGKNYQWATGDYDIYFYHYNETIIWGITARIVHSIIHLMEEFHLF